MRITAVRAAVVVMTQQKTAHCLLSQEETHQLVELCSFTTPHFNMFLFHILFVAAGLGFT